MAECLFLHKLNKLCLLRVLPTNFSTKISTTQMKVVQMNIEFYRTGFLFVFCDYVNPKLGVGYLCVFSYVFI